MERSLPEFLIVGAMKAGTTALADYLRGRSDVFIPLLKEPFYFSDQETAFGFPYRRNLTPIDFAVSSYEEYVELFSDAGNKIKGEATAQYIHDVTSPRKVYEKNPNCKIIISIREPVSRAYSAYIYTQMKGFEDGKSFEDTVSEEMSGARDRFFGEFKYLESSKYTSNVKRWVDQFGRDKVLVLFSDELRQKDTYERVLTFLGADTTNIDAVKSSNTSFVPKNGLHRMIWRLSASRSLPKRVLLALFPRKLLKPFQRKVDEFVANSGVRPDKINGETKAQLKEFFRQDMIELTAYLQEIGYEKFPVWLEDYRRQETARTVKA
ncbi:sulfotransferase domain-containing protein [uncultured Roseibium sp.]|uniref:sulfotransferase domain-containing protein n=1 Tax=uncultured Roseibium sp. TaxID=1936171 RepID=UPI002598E93A|nr:sulfotransferase domain-containing protein [uncultured Roseibium sp.]